LDRQKFGSNTEIIDATIDVGYFEEKDKSYWKSWKNLSIVWIKCI